MSLPTPKEVALTLVAEARAAPDVTQMKEFQPWATTTSLSSGIKVIGTLSGGDCWTESLPDYDNQDAWRCMAGSVIHDPCFAAPHAANVRQVACAASPTGGVYLMNLTTALPQSSSSRTSGGTYAWYIVLSNGEGCLAVRWRRAADSQWRHNRLCMYKWRGRRAQSRRSSVDRSIRTERCWPA